MFHTLLAGGCVFVPSEYELSNDLSSAINRPRADIFILTPTMAYSIHPEALTHRTSLTMAMGGEPVTRKGLELWLLCARVYNTYGPAECNLTCFDRERTAVNLTKPSNIGIARGAREWLVDPNDHNRLAPIGDISEILLEGALLA